MENFIKLQNILIDPKKTFDDFKYQLLNSQITQFTYLCLLLNISATIKRQNFNFQQYLDLLSNFKNQPGYRSACINYTGYKDKISILMNACQKSVSSTVYILTHHPDIKLHLVDPNGFNAVFYAIKNPDQSQGLKMLQILKDISPQIIDTVINNGYSPLFLAVQKFRIKIVDFLLRNDIDPNQKLDSNGNTVMHQLVKISSRYSLQQVKKMIQTFLRHGFDLTIKNSLQRTVQQYAFDFRFNLTQIINEIKVNKIQFKTNSEFGFKSQSSQTEAQSSNFTHNKNGDLCNTNYNYSERQESEYLNQIQNFSISDDKSLFSQVIYKQKHVDQREKQFSVEMNINQSQNQEQIEDSQLQEIQRKMECHSHSDSPKSQFNKQQKSVQVSEIDSFSEGNSSQKSDGSFIKMETINFIKLHQDILQFDQISQEIYFSAWRQIQPFFVKLTEITQCFGLVIEVVGSFATGLWTHHSDIDIALIATNQNFIDFQRLLEKLYGKIKVRMYNLGIKQLSYNKASKVPSIKIQMDPYLFSSRKIDIMIFHKKNVAISYVNFIREALTTYPFIRPLYFFLKRVCQQFGLHDPFNGGMKSYSIFLMIFQIAKTLEQTSLGQIILKISYYYGFVHEYDYEIEYRKDWQSQDEPIPVLRLNIKDPLNLKNNMGGKNTDTYKVKNMFRTIFYGLHKQITKGTHLQHILQMSKLVYLQ